MAKYKAYPEYKDSGVEWLGEVPEQWLIKKLKYLCAVQTGSRDTVNAVEEGLYPFFVRSQTIERINSVGADCEAVLTAGDGVGVGKVYHYYNGKFDYHQRVYMLNKFKFITGRFVFYYLSSNFYKVALEGNAKSTVDSLRLPQFLNFEFSIPSIKEQNFITTFLDHETAKIDKLIEKQQQLIELLKEKRQAVISHAVTKGLNPDVPMKDSGVEWLGEVPVHWVIAQLKFNTLEMQTGPFGSQLHAEDYVVDGIPLINPAHMYSGEIIPDPKVTVDEDTQKRLERHKLKEGDIVFSRRGELGRCAVVRNEQEGWLCGTGSLKAKLNAGIIPNYAYILVSSEGVVSELTLESKGSTMANLNTETLGRVRIPVPPLHEQEEILSYVGLISKKYDLLINNADMAISLMQERRTALISAAVTGKIDVRDWVAPNVCDAEVSQEATA